MKLLYLIGKIVRGISQMCGKNFETSSLVVILAFVKSLYRKACID